MELLKGQNLPDRLAGAPMKIHQLVDIGIQIADLVFNLDENGLRDKVTPLVGFEYSF
jgi:hypothetical protein